VALYLRYAVRSDLGLVRNNNEDSVYAGPRLLAIADGMGGHAAGEVASKIVIGALEPLDEDRRIDDLMRMLRDTVVEANHRIADAVKQRKDLEGMGTTLTALRFVGSQVGLVHVGDSRAYLMRGGMLSQITHDDTYVQYLVDSGKLTPDEAKDHPRKSVILRALLGSDVEPDVSIREARAGDRYLLCSDGLSDVVSTETIAETLQISDPQESADRLVELALRGGGPDNVTVIVADVINARVGDMIDGVPVVDGAFVDPSAAEVPGADSAAERAARMARPAPAEPATPTAHRRTFRWKPWLIVLGVLVVILAALGGFYAWTQTQYFVGRAGEDVAIYQGVNADFGPLKFYDVYKVTSLPMSHLTPSARSQVNDGITASSKQDAESIVANLYKTALIDACQSPEPGSTQSTTPPVPNTSSARPPTSPHASSSPRTTRTSRASSPSRHATSSAPKTAGSSTRSTTAATPPTTSSPSPSPTATCPPP
jgi:PPM family protein phosphatase